MQAIHGSCLRAYLNRVGEGLVLLVFVLVQVLMVVAGATGLAMLF
jgi:hypothetical protein